MLHSIFHMQVFQPFLPLQNTFKAGSPLVDGIVKVITFSHC